MSKIEDLQIEYGLPPGLRAAAAELYLEAFRQKLVPILGARGRAVLEASLNPERAICALQHGRLLGLIGYKCDHRAFFEPSLAQLTKHYGLLQGWLKAAVLALFERPQRAGELLLDGIAVHPTSRGQGVGTRLLNAVLTMASAKGLQSVRLDVVDTNPAARRLYERLGFVPVKTNQYAFLRPIFGFSASTMLVKDLG